MAFRRTRFLWATILSSPAVVFAYSPLLVVQTVAGIAVPFATGRFINALVNGESPIMPFIALATLLLVKAAYPGSLKPDARYEQHTGERGESDKRNFL